MSTRGKPPGSAPRPVTPPDPSLITHPVPSHRHHKPISFGKGARLDLPYRSVEELDELPEADAALSNDSYYRKSHDDVRRLLEVICDLKDFLKSDNTPVDIATWGFMIFVTEYSSLALEKLCLAMENLVKVTERSMSSTPPAYKNEAIRRLKFDLIQDKENLDGASDDRIREEFKSLLRGQSLMNEEDSPEIFIGSTVGCLVFDEKTITMLADLEFDDSVRDYSSFKGNNIKITDLFWVRGETEWPDLPNARPYRGVDECPIVCLQSLNSEFSTSGFGGELEDRFPLQSKYYL